MFVRLRKPTRVALLALALVSAYASVYFLLSTPRDRLLLNLSIWYDKITSSSVALDTDAAFNEAVQALMQENIKSDKTHTFDFLEPDYSPPVEVEVPEYFVDASAARPPVQPFDPRLTLWAYMHWARTHAGEKMPFHWADWVDLSAVHKYVFVANKPSCKELFTLAPKEAGDSPMMPVWQYCHEDGASPVGLRISRFPSAQTRENARLLGKLHLFHGAPPPAKVVFLTNGHGAYHVDVAGTNSLDNGLLHNGVVEGVLENLKNKGNNKNEHNNNNDGNNKNEHVRANVLEAYGALLAQAPTVPHAEIPAQLALDPSWFEVDAAREAQRIEQQPRDAMAAAYAASLRHSLRTPNPPKSFNEARFLNSDPSRLLGDHHDWRFFDGLTLHTDRQVVALHRLLKNYLHFCRAHGLVTWIAHGSLLSWYWNGMAFPWDADTDVQMPLRDLHRLAREFNQTLVVENVGHDHNSDPTNENTNHQNENTNHNVTFGGMAAFFVDVGSSITVRSRANGMNNIDARFIDIHTGLYVDITGLAVSDVAAPERYHTGPGGAVANRAAHVYNCRNHHFTSLDELSPLVVAGVQNQLGHVPSQFGAILDHEYGVAALKSRTYRGYVYLDSLRVWSAESNVRERVGAKENKRDAANPWSLLQREDYVRLLSHAWLLREYMATRSFTGYHEAQMRRLLWGRVADYTAHAQEYARSPATNAAMWGDFFMGKVARDAWDYGREVRKTLEMAKLYGERKSSVSKPSAPPAA
ncbi:hypothetical protein CLUG_04884 [Clavispora lusitaniae ATCC 42720]|uniref:LicD/FKTN/FKRP nucleotidyltransferase domain-containing protein n=1 Tax=Clavispora lusitaniae (strain ATCC 42720) TaxID=306902 RepID=C4Y9J4_CLAL4|nr:uncharacterized protein CLUG_04884 [Clavispora lusitaniae ATCC 42720]EEQ40756.1 hypothetical protein CLUG_04884 [Clavispora lusitaniae ATCC 42720]